MENNFDSRLKEMLQSHQAMPPKACWEQIAANLDAVPTPQPSTPSSQLSHSFFSSAIGKVSVALTIASVATIATFIALTNNNKEQTTDLNPVTTPPAKEAIAIPTNEASSKPAIIKEEKAATPVAAVIDTNADYDHEPATPAVMATNMEPVVQKEAATMATSTPANTPTEKEETPSVQTAAYTPAAGSEEEEEETEETLQVDISIPNIITPNGDGINDCFEIEGTGQTSLNHMMIYTKQGKVIFDQKNYSNNWCADHVTDGTYFYIFRYLVGEKQYMRKGSITVRR